jgi:hypothetical protein
LETNKKIPNGASNQTSQTAATCNGTEKLANNEVQKKDGKKQPLLVKSPFFCAVTTQPTGFVAQNAAVQKASKSCKCILYQQSRHIRICHCYYVNHVLATTELWRQSWSITVTYPEAKGGLMAG